MATDRPPRVVRDLLADINRLTSELIGTGLVNDQNFPSSRRIDAVTYVVEYSNSPSYAELLKDKPYEDTYLEQLAGRLYNFRMLDNALIQLSYEVSDGDLRRARLAYLPEPRALSFQEDPDIFLIESPYSEIFDANAIPVPVRFDFDDRPGVSADVVHPTSHLTLGQYKNCRVAATAGVSPSDFIEFITRCFYSTGEGAPSLAFPRNHSGWRRTISTEEETSIHIGVPHTS